MIMENIADKRRDNLLRIAEVKARTTLSSATIYRRISAGTFPRPHRISAGLTAWYESEIDSWVADPMGYRAGVQNEVGV